MRKPCHPTGDVGFYGMGCGVCTCDPAEMDGDPYRLALVRCHSTSHIPEESHQGVFRMCLDESCLIV